MSNKYAKFSPEDWTIHGQAATRRQAWKWLKSHPLPEGYISAIIPSEEGVTIWIRVRPEQKPHIYRAVTPSTKEGWQMTWPELSKRTLLVETLAENSFRPFRISFFRKLTVFCSLCAVPDSNCRYTLVDLYDHVIREYLNKHRAALDVKDPFVYRQAVAVVKNVRKNLLWRDWSNQNGFNIH